MTPWTRHFEEALTAHVKSLVPQGTVLREAALYAIQTPGKRLRPLLVEESSRLVSLLSRPTQLLQFAVELIHTFSLVHDDLPCLDNDDFRRGHPTVHKKFGEAQAMLAGDLLFQLGVHTLLQAGSQLEPSAYMRGTLHFLDCVGARGLIGGQSSEFEKQDRMSEAELIEIQDQKTTALFRASILTPFYWAGVSESEALFQDAREFANAFGFAFQIADDLEDAAQDAQSGAKNVLSLYGAGEAKDRARRALESSRLAEQFSVTTLLLNKLR